MQKYGREYSRNDIVTDCYWRNEEETRFFTTENFSYLLTNHYAKRDKTSSDYHKKEDPIYLWIIESDYPNALDCEGTSGI